MNVPAFVTYVLVTTFTPGPNNIMAMSNGLQDGFRKSLRFLVGVFVGFFLLMILCGYLNCALVSLSPKAKFWLNLLGAGYMIYLGVYIALAKHAEKTGNGRLFNTFKAGTFMQFLNLKGILYGVTVFSTFIIPYHQDMLTLTIYSISLAAVVLIATTCWAEFGVMFRAFFSKYSTIINISLGLLLIYSAIAGFLSGSQKGA